MSTAKTANNFTRILFLLHNIHISCTVEKLSFMYVTLAAMSVSFVSTSFSVVAMATLTTVQCSHQLGVTLARQRLSALKYGCHFLTYTLYLTIVVQLPILLNYWIKSDRVISLSVWVVFTESACFYYMCRVLHWWEVWMQCQWFALQHVNKKDPDMLQRRGLSGGSTSADSKKIYPIDISKATSDSEMYAYVIETLFNRHKAGDHEIPNHIYSPQKVEILHSTISIFLENCTIVCNFCNFISRPTFLQCCAQVSQKLFC